MSFNEAIPKGAYRMAATETACLLLKSLPLLLISAIQQLPDLTLTVLALLSKI